MCGVSEDDRVLHQDQRTTQLLEHNGGSLEKAMANANRSVEEKMKSDRDYTYSELGRLMERLESI